MEAWRMYYVQRKPTTAIAEHFGVSRQSIRNWIVSLGGQLMDDEHDRAFREKIAVTLPAGTMLCQACDIIAERDESGLCPSCRGDVESEHEQEIRAEIELFSDAAFLNNPRNIGRFNPATIDCIRGVIPTW
jgi:hypothetical protein